MLKYTYRREWLPDDELLARCNALGDEGWALLGAPVWVPPHYDMSPDVAEWEQVSVGVWRCFFKRTVSSREQADEGFRLNPRYERTTP